MSVDEPTLVLGWAVDNLRHRHLIRGEDTALVRPYVLAHEGRTTHQLPTVIVASRLPIDAWSALVGAH
ncbi:hypothetical protein [Streptomyces luteogriseus]|uniref:hypothetical protein n=1 Tax=Streptomyces luteogriseus TaxID=68233 RepID=UPI0037B762C0